MSSKTPRQYSTPDPPRRTNTTGSDCGPADRSLISRRGGPILGAALMGTVLVVPSAHAMEEDAAEYTITANPSESGADIADTMYGIFLEDINFAGDGGLYPERVQNRSFEFGPVDNEDYHPLTGWSEESVGAAGGSVEVVDDEGRLNENNRQYAELRLEGDGAGPDAGFGLVNSGFFDGMAVEEGAEFEVSVWARTDQEDGNDLSFALRSSGSGELLADEAVLTVEEGEWTQYSTTITTHTAADDGELAVIAGGSGTVALDMVSLYPEDTFNGHANGLRPDIARTIDGLDPDFLRFPGGCLVNTGSHESYEEPDWERGRSFQWKDTVGPVEERPTNANWWGYNQSYGLGYFEYFQFAQDLGATPIPVVPALVTGCGQDDVTDDEELLNRHIQDTLDLVEFANGPADSEWGSVRAQMGHPEPFGLTHVQVGNEEPLGEEFFEHFLEFKEALEAEHPEITVVGNSGPASGGDNFDRLWELNDEAGVDLVDEHYYEEAEWFLANHHRYDGYDREGPNVFLGEYGSWGNTFHNALAEAAYLTGLERNADIVELVAYAPLLAHEEGTQWEPDLIWFDNSDVWGSANYEVSRLFSTQTGDSVVPTEATLPGGADEELFRQVVTRDTQTGDLIVKVVNVHEDEAVTHLELGEEVESGATATVTTLQGDPKAVNTRDDRPIQPEETVLEGVDATFEYTFPGHSVTFLRVPTV